MAGVVVAVAGTILVGALVRANRSHELRIERALLTQLVASQLALLDDEITARTSTDGTYPAPLDDVRWTLAWTPRPLAPLVQTTLTVSRKDHDVHVVTYRRLAKP